MPSLEFKNYLNGNQTETIDVLKGVNDFDRLKLVADAFNQMDLGFTISVTKSENSDSAVSQLGFEEVIISSSVPLKENFFTGPGPFWSAARMVDSGFTYRGQVTSEEISLIVTAEMHGIDTEWHSGYSEAEWLGKLEQIRAQLQSAGK